MSFQNNAKEDLLKEFYKKEIIKCEHLQLVICQVRFVYRSLVIRSGVNLLNGTIQHRRVITPTMHSQGVKNEARQVRLLFYNE